MAGGSERAAGSKVRRGGRGGEEVGGSWGDSHRG